MRKMLQDMREVLKMLKRRRSSKKYCPRCGSPDIRLSSGSGYWLTPLKYVCKKCGYSGPVVMELEKEEG
jgi:predicted RNA-binding Zn-ribbon protein involved in translation (DUF1610 family)